ncbi:MAG: PDZ domain-containing protein [Deltaproteobacteria bacterium]|nr:PDZ domain-containing protein [Deltaproteobacteria bacterium]
MRALCSFAVATSLAACSGIPVRARPGPVLPVQAVAVYPCEFRWEEPAYRSFELSEALALQASATGRYSVFGPGEFKLVRNSSDNPFVGSDIALQLADRGLSPMAALVVKPTLERRAQSAVKQLYDQQGRPKGAARVEEATVFARLEVFHSASREIVADASASVEVDPLAARDATDPMPEVTALLQRMMSALLAAIADRAPGQTVDRSPGFQFVWNPRAALDFALDGKPALAEAISRLDILEQDVALEARLRFFLPHAEPSLLSRLRRLPGGLYVTTVFAAGSSGLQAGDLILSINGEPALPQTLQRALRSSLPGQQLALRVRRSTGLTDLSLVPP